MLQINVESSVVTDNTTIWNINPLWQGQSTSVNSHINTHKHADIYTHKHIHAQIHMKTNTRTHTQTHGQMDTHRLTHTNMHENKHTHTQRCPINSSCSWPLFASPPLPVREFLAHVLLLRQYNQPTPQSLPSPFLCYNTVRRNHHYDSLTLGLYISPWSLTLRAWR